MDKLNEAFNHINLVYRDWVENELQSQSALSPQHKNASPPRVLIDQNVMFEEIFQKIGSEPDLRKTETLLLAYFNSLAEHGIPSQFNLNKLLVSSLVSCLAGNLTFVRGKLYRPVKTNFRPCTSYFSTASYQTRNQWPCYCYHWVICMPRPPKWR